MISKHKKPPRHAPPGDFGASHKPKLSACNAFRALQASVEPQQLPPRGAVPVAVERHGGRCCLPGPSASSFSRSIRSSSTTRVMAGRSSARISSKSEPVEARQLAVAGIHAVPDRRDVGIEEAAVVAARPARRRDRAGEEREPAQLGHDSRARRTCARRPPRLAASGLPGAPTSRPASSNVSRMAASAIARARPATACRASPSAAWRRRRRSTRRRSPRRGRPCRRARRGTHTCPA